MEDLQVHAIARIIFGRDIPHIQASWTKMGVKLSQVTLCCGANDFGGTMMEDKITTAGGAKYGEYKSREQIWRRSSGRSAACPGSAIRSMNPCPVTDLYEQR